MFDRYSFQFKAVRACLLGACLALTSCAEECNGSTEATVLFSKPEPQFGGERIYVDVRNRGEIGVRKTLKCANGMVGTFDNVVVVRDFRSRFRGRKRICFSAFYRMAPTDGARMNSEGLPEIQLYQ